MIFLKKKKKNRQYKNLPEDEKQKLPEYRKNYFKICKKINSKDFN